MTTSRNPRIMRMNHLNREKFRESGYIQPDYFYGKARNANLVSTIQHQFNPHKKNEDNQYSQVIPDPAFNNNGTNVNYYKKSSSVNIAPNSSAVIDRNVYNPITGGLITTRPITTYGKTHGTERLTDLQDNDPLSMTTNILPSHKSYREGYMYEKPLLENIKDKNWQKDQQRTPKRLAPIDSTYLGLNSQSADISDYRLANQNNEFSLGHNRINKNRIMAHRDTNIPSRHLFSTADRFRVREGYYEGLRNKKYDIDQVDIAQSSYVVGGFNDYKNGKIEGLEKSMNNIDYENHIQKSVFQYKNGREAEIKKRLETKTFVPTQQFYC